jgi:hypothetical protein
MDSYLAFGGKGTYDKGVLTRELSEWKEFFVEAVLFRDYKDYVWRGQRRHGDEWSLKSTFDRRNSGSDRKKILENHKEQFRRAIRGRRGTNPPDLNDEELWALGQHHDLATPLLDWTESPYVAAYFAFYEEEDDSRNLTRVVYGLNRRIEKWSYKGHSERFIKFPKIDTHENARLLAQGGVFTEALEGGDDVKRRVQKCYKDANVEKPIILAEIFIPNKCRHECLKDLNMMNINHATLFPDIFGSAIFCNLKLEIDKS